MAAVEVELTVAEYPHQAMMVLQHQMVDLVVAAAEQEIMGHQPIM